MNRFIATIIAFALAVNESSAFSSSNHGASSLFSSRDLSGSSFRAQSANSIRVSAACAELTTVDDREHVKDRKKNCQEKEELDDNFEEWKLRLFNDSKNTRGYICRCLTQVVGVSESHSYHTMEKAHACGVSTVGVFRQEQAEFYKESLTNSGLCCEIVPVHQ